MDLNKLPRVIDTFELTPDNFADIANTIEELFQNSACVDMLLSSHKTNGEWKPRVSRSSDFLKYDRTSVIDHDPMYPDGVAIIFNRSKHGDRYFSLSQENNTRVGFCKVNGNNAVYFSARDRSHKSISPFFRYQVLLIDSVPPVDPMKR